jgi:hypothetical protein
MTRPFGKVCEEVCLVGLSRKTIVRVAVLLAACLSPILALAQTDAWKGGTGNWNDSTKWSAGVPTSTSNVFIDNGNPSASAVTVSDVEQSGNLTIDSDDSVSVLSNALLTVSGPTISNAGTLAIAATSGGANFDISGAVTLTGAGTLNMSNSANNIIFGYGQGTGATLTNESTIQGSGTIQPGCSNTFNNQHIVNANQSTPLILSICSGPSTNTGKLEATNGGTLTLEGNTEGAGTFDNTGGGIIHAEPSSIVQLYGSAIVKNGTLTTSGSGAVQCAGNNGFCTLDGATNSGTHQVVSGGEYLANTITNNGSFQVGTISTGVNLDISGNVILKGTGTLSMSNLSTNTLFGYGQGTGATLTNQSTIQGSGTIQPGCSNTFNNQHIVNANQSTPLYISICNGPSANTGTLEATNGGTLVLEGNSEGAGTFDNTGGTIHADASSTVVLYDSAIVKNGNLTSSNPGKTQCNGSNGDCTLDGATLSGTHQVITGAERLTNTVANNGSFQMLGTNSNNVSLYIYGSPVLAGSGTLTMGGPGNTIFGFYQPSPGNTLTNESTIQGGGTINPSSGNNFINQHIVSATQNLTINGNFTNPGTLKVSKGRTLYISGGLFSNFSGNTLTGGKYMVTGSLLFDGASIANNAAGIILTGTTALIGNQSAVNALTGFSTNENTSSFTVTGGQQFATTLSGNFSNAGKVTAAKNSAFKVLCNPSFVCNYVQTAGTTTVDGVLTVAVGNVSLQGGKLFGTGTVAASVNSKASVTAGDTLTKAGTLSVSTYTQESTASLNVQIGGTTLGTQYSRLAVANGASLAGTLKIKLINGFVPAIGNTFTVLTGSAVTGKFATVNGLSINSTEHFTIAYNATNVTLTVVSGP